MKKKSVSILFIGNSHTYVNDMPEMVRRRAKYLWETIRSDLQKRERQEDA